MFYYKLKKSSLLLILLLALIDCSPIPRTTLRPYQDQPEILAAQHWRDLADSVVRDYINNKRVIDLSATSTTKNRNVYIQKGLDDSAFDRVFYNYLVNSFIKNGYSISKLAKDSNVINFTTETYLYSYDRRQKSLLTYAIFGLAAEKLLIALDNRDIDLLAFGLVFDYLTKDNDLKNAEVILNVSIENQKSITYQFNKEFYINPHDMPLYWSIRPPNTPRLEGIDTDGPLKIVSVPVLK